MQKIIWHLGGFEAINLLINCSRHCYQFGQQLMWWSKIWVWNSNTCCCWFIQWWWY